MLICISEVTGWEKLPTRQGDLVLSVRPATAAPAGETSALQTGKPDDSQHINTIQCFQCFWKKIIHKVIRSAVINMTAA